MTPAAPTPQKRRFGLAPLAAALAALLVVIAGGAWWLLDANRPASVATKAPAEAARLSIVVLPFANLSGDPGQDYLVDALTDELTTSLARIRDTFVIARNTAMTFKGKPVDAKAIGKDLGVRYVLEGSVQPSGDRMRVNAQLIDADSGAHLWAEQFDTRDPRQDHVAGVRTHSISSSRPRALAQAARLQPSRGRQDCVTTRRAAAKSSYVVNEDYRLCEQALAIDHNVDAPGLCRRGGAHAGVAWRFWRPDGRHDPTMSAPDDIGVKCARRLAIQATLKAHLERATNWSRRRSHSIRRTSPHAKGVHSPGDTRKPSRDARLRTWTVQLAVGDLGEFDYESSGYVDKPDISTRRFEQPARSVARSIGTAARRGPISG